MYLHSEKRCKRMRDAHKCSSAKQQQQIVYYYYYNNLWHFFLNFTLFYYNIIITYLWRKVVVECGNMFLYTLRRAYIEMVGCMHTKFVHLKATQTTTTTWKTTVGAVREILQFVYGWAYIIIIIMKIVNYRDCVVVVVVY